MSNKLSVLFRKLINLVGLQMTISLLVCLFLIISWIDIYTILFAFALCSFVFVWGCCLCVRFSLRGKYLYTVLLSLFYSVLCIFTHEYISLVDSAHNFKTVCGVRLKNESKSLGLYVCDYKLIKPAIIGSDTIRPKMWVQYKNAFMNHATRNDIEICADKFEYVFEIDTAITTKYGLPITGFQVDYDEQGKRLCTGSDVLPSDRAFDSLVVYPIIDNDYHVLDSLVYVRSSLPKLRHFDVSVLRRKRTFIQRIGDLFYYDEVRRYLLWKENERRTKCG